MPAIARPSLENQPNLTDLLPKILAQYPSFSLKSQGADFQIRENQLLTKFNTARLTLVQDLRQKRYVLKEFPWYCSNESFVEAVLEYQERLKAYLSIPKILKTRQGKLYVQCEEGKSFFFLQEFTKGYAWNASYEQAYSLGTFLGDFHSYAQTMPKVLVPQETVFAFSLSLCSLTKSINEPHWNSIKDYFMQEVGQRFQEMENQAQNMGYGNTLFAIHGDYNYTNTLFGNHGEVVALLDFDNCLIDNPIHDVAQALLYAGCVKLKQGTPFFDTIAPVQKGAMLISCFIEAYRQANPMLYQKIIELLPLAVRAVYLKMIVVGFLRGDFSAQAFLSYYEKMDSIAEYIEKGISKKKRDNT